MDCSAPRTMRAPALLCLLAGCANAAPTHSDASGPRPPADARPSADAPGVPDPADAAAGDATAGDAAPVDGDAGALGPPAPCSGPTGDFGGIQMIPCVPEGLEGSSGDPRPLVLVLPGYTHDPMDMLATTEWNVLAGAYGFYVVFAKAPNDRAWYWYTGGRSRGQPDPAALVAVIDAMKASHAVDPDRVYVSGLSAGGYMAVNLLADYPEVFAAGGVTSGGAHGCDVTCPSAPSGGDDVAAVHGEHPSYWNDPDTRKPRLLVLHGELDQVNVPGNATELVQQWTGALGTDATPDNAALGIPTELEGYPYEVFADGDEIVVESVRMTDLGHGTPVDPGDAPDQGGHDPTPSQTADPCGVCPQDWTNTGNLYGPYHEARFFGLVP